MKRVLFVFIALALALQVAFAQGGRIVTIYFHNGSVVKGEISKLPNDERFRLQTSNGSVFLFTSQEVRDVLYEDGTRPGSPAQSQQQYPPRQQQPQQQYPQQQYQQQPQQQYPQQQYQQPQQQYPQQQYQQQYQQRQPSQQQAYPPSYQQNQGNQQYQLPPSNRQQVDNGVVDTGEGMDDEFYDDYEDAGMDTDIDETPSRPSRRTAAGADRRDVAPKAALDFVPGYHGVIDFGYTFGLGDSIHAFSRMELTITQGYQFTPSLFAGLGTGVHLYSDSVQLRKIVDNVAIDNSYLSYVFPIFVDVRYNFSGGQIRPFAALKVGYGIGLSKTTTVSVTEGGSSSRKTEYKAESLGFYIAPSVGAKFMIGRSIAFSLGVGYSMQMYGSETFKSGDPTIKIKSTDIMGGLTIKAGLEF